MTTRKVVARIALGAFLILGVAANLSYPLPGLLPFLSYGLVGSLLVVRRPGHPIGWLLILMAIGFSIVFRPSDVVSWAIAAGHATWLPLLAWIGAMSGIGLFTGMALLAAVFPTGAMPSGGIGRITRAALALIGVIGLVQAVDPAFATTLADGTPVVIVNPVGIAPEWSGWSLLDGPAYVVVLLALSICVVGLVVRFRRATGIERQQDRWLLASLALIAIAVSIGFVGMFLVGPETAWIWFPALLAFPLPPIAIGIAIMRYRLYEIDRLVSRTISYGAVSATLLAVYAGMILLLQGPLGAITGGDTVAVAASTLAAAALFQPVRRRIQGAVDHRFNRAGYDAERTVAGLASRLRDQMDLPVVSRAVVDAVVASVEPTGANLWLRLGRTP
jgi:hypothetical protein